MSYVCVFKRSPLGVKICLSHAQIGLLLGSQKAQATPTWSPLGVKFKIHMGVPPPGCQQVPALYKQLIQDKNELTNELLTDGSY